MKMTESNMEDVYPLGMAIATMIMSLFGVFGNSLIVIATMSDKSLQHRCNFLIATLALADIIASAYFVQLRIIIMLRGFYWTNVKCFLWSVYGLMALNVQSGMGLVLGVDRLLAIVQPVRYRNWDSKKYLIFSIVPVLCYSVAITGFGWTQTTNNATVVVCLPPTAYASNARMVWVFSNVFIVFLVLIAYGTAQYKIRRANHSSHSEEGIIVGKRLLTSLSCVMVVYSATWALTVAALFANQV
uniref:G-protein coupled receptors family 1 profile domain-containing protein n=1 Tax=Plectus sambesii TaxID=2011161 RepID=A0A914WN53_9BILA